MKKDKPEEIDMNAKLDKINAIKELMTQNRATAQMANETKMSAEDSLKQLDQAIFDLEESYNRLQEEYDRLITPLKD